MEYDRLPFPEAVEELAGRLGLGSRTRSAPRRDARGADALPPLYDLLGEVAEFYTPT